MSCRCWRSSLVCLVGALGPPGWPVGCQSDRFSCRVFAHAENSYDTGAARYSAARENDVVLRRGSTSVACCLESRV